MSESKTREYTVTYCLREPIYYPGTEVISEMKVVLNDSLTVNASSMEEAVKRVVDDYKGSFDIGITGIYTVD